MNIRNDLKMSLDIEIRDFKSKSSLKYLKLQIEIN